RSAPCRPTCWRGNTGVKMRIVPSESLSVSSTMTTASAPAGIGAPVAISVHWPGPTSRDGTCPVKTCSTHSSIFGSYRFASDASSLSFRYLLYHVAQLGNHQACQRQPHGILRSRQHEDRLSNCGTGNCAAQHRGWTNFLEAQHAEQLAKSVQPLLEQAIDRFE